MNAFVSLLRMKPMVLIMSLPDNDGTLTSLAFAAGADVVKVHCNVSHRASGTGFDSFASYQEVFAEMLEASPGPVGLVPGAAIEDVLRDMEAAAALPFDFFSLYAHHVPPTLLSLPQALMAACGPAYTMEEVAQFEAVGVQVMEASIIPPDGYGAPLSLQDVIAYRSLCVATRLPVVVPTQRCIEPEALPYLRDAGVKGIMIGAIVTGHAAGSIARSVEAFRNAIDRL